MKGKRKEGSKTMLAPLIAVTLLAATPGPLEKVKSGYASVQKVATAPDATVEKLATTLDTFVDFEELARRAMGETWSTLTPAQRKELASEMRSMLRTFYAHRVFGHGQSEVTYGEVTVQGNEATVHTTVTAKRMRIPIAYKLYREARRPQDWRIYDIVTDNISLLESYRVQFAKLMDTQGFDRLLAIVKTRRAQVEKAAAARQPPGAK
jgi:phospholipid transport system substrate-binding protein